MTIYIKSLKDLEGMIKSKIANELYFSSNLQDVVAEKMHDNIIENVYNAFEPKEYERRGNSDGFSDMNNMQFTSSEVVGNTVHFTFENTTEGNDSMSGEELAEMFETGDRSSWDNPHVMDGYGRINSSPRPFIQSTIDDLNQNKAELVNALKKDLKNLGFDVK